MKTRQERGASGRRSSLASLANGLLSKLASEQDAERALKAKMAYAAACIRDAQDAAQLMDSSRRGYAKQQLLASLFHALSALEGK